MPYIPVPNTAQLELIYDWGGQVCETVLHYVKASPWTVDLLTDLCESATLEWDAVMQTQMPTTLSLIGVRATDLASQTGAVVNYGTGLPLAGTAVSPSLPNNVALVVTKRTALRGRSYRGRLYHPGLNEGQVTGNIVGPSSVATIVGLWNNFLSLAVTGDEANMCVVSRYNNLAPRVTGVATLVTNLTSDGFVDSQRRRLPGRGN